MHTPTFLSVIFLSQGSEPVISGPVSGLLIALLLVCLAAGWLFTKLKAAQKRLASLTVEHQSTTDAHRALLEKERKQGKTLQSKREEITELKRELAAQKKKNHAAKEAERKLRKDLQQQIEEVSKAREAKPAFAEKPESKPEPVEKKPEKPVEQEKQEPKKTEQVTQPQKGEVERKLTRLEAEHRAQGEALTKERTAHKSARQELRNLRRRVEGLRRIDLISSGKIELLEDKLHAMGRQYYDAVSELAALKGEVKPPPPRDLAKERPSHKEREEVEQLDAQEDVDGMDAAEEHGGTVEETPEETSQVDAAEEEAELAGAFEETSDEASREEENQAEQVNVAPDEAEAEQTDPSVGETEGETNQKTAESSL